MVELGSLGIWRPKQTIHGMGGGEGGLGDTMLSSE